MTRPLRVGLVADYREEGWPSMDLVADMVEQHVPHVAGGEVSIEALRAPFVRRLPWPRHGRPRTAERVLNRFWDYPRWLRARAGDFDVFHVVDHSYAHLVDALPPGRTIAFCHDADAFGAFFGDGHHPSLLPRRLSGRVLAGLQQAARVLCISRATRDALADHRLVRPERLSVVPLGVHPSCSPASDPRADAEAARLLGGDRIDLLHVGSTIARKRIDLLLRVTAAARAARPHVRLVRVGGPLTADQDRLARELGVRDHLLELPFLDRPVLAAVYRRAALVALTSEREGFGLPIVEALACGTPVVATDLPVCREVGGDDVEYCALDRVDRWAASIDALLAERDRDPGAWRARADRGVVRAGAFSWSACATACVDAYRRVAASGGAA
jgi:glycosyltransferase involved in cell wall biosynthesis